MPCDRPIAPRPAGRGVPHARRYCTLDPLEDPALRTPRDHRSAVRLLLTASPQVSAPLHRRANPPRATAPAPPPRQHGVGGTGAAPGPSFWAASPRFTFPLKLPGADTRQQTARPGKNKNKTPKPNKQTPFAFQGGFLLPLSPPAPGDRSALTELLTPRPPGRSPPSPPPGQRESGGRPGTAALAGTHQHVPEEQLRRRVHGPVDGPTVGDLDADHQRLALHGAGGAAEQPEHPRPAGLTCCGGPRGLPSRAEPAPPRPARRKDSLPRNQNGGTGRRDEGEGGGGGGEEGAEAAPCCGEEAGAVRAVTARPGERAAAAPASAEAPILIPHRLMASTFNRENTVEAANQSQARTPAFVKKCGKSPVFKIQSHELSLRRRQLFLKNSRGFCLQVIQSNTQKRGQT